MELGSRTGSGVLTVRGYRRPTLVRFKNENLDEAVREASKKLEVSASDWMSDAAAWVLEHGGVEFALAVRKGKSPRGRPRNDKA